MFYQILTYTPRHGFDTQMLRKEILVFYNSCFWKEYLRRMGIYSVYPSKNEIRRFFLKK